MDASHDREWSERLRGFTARNAGRRTQIEVDDPAVGAQTEERELPLRGAAYDRRDRSVEIMLGEQGDPARHLTHVVRDVRSVDLLARPDGRDDALRIATEDGQTILRLAR